MYKIIGSVSILKIVDTNTFAVASLSSAPKVLARIIILAIHGIEDCIMRTDNTSLSGLNPMRIPRE